MIPCFKIKQQSAIYIEEAQRALEELLPESRVVVIADANIDRRYHALLSRHEYMLVGLGETVKTLQTVEAIYHWFVEIGVDRTTFVLGIGGGIVTDLTGFVASTYMRGLSFGFVSTTLLGQVDASIGGKNGVNVDGYKNMVGTFNQPRFVICDIEMLKSLPDNEFRAGLAEVVKAAIIADPALFALLESTTFKNLRSDRALLARVVQMAVQVKVQIVERDEREGGERRKLNLGHTLGHAIEKLSRRMTHGEAVAVGTVLIVRAAARAGILSVADCDRIVNLLTAFGFDLVPPVEVRRLLTEVSRDKKVEHGSVRVVLPVGIGNCQVRQFSLSEFELLILPQGK